MNSLNSVLLEGNLTGDPEKIDMENGGIVTKFQLASSRFRTVDGTGVEDVIFFDVEACNRVALLCLKSLAKGRGVRVVGRLAQDRWTDKDGKNHTKVKIVAETVEFKPKWDKRSADVPVEV